MMSVIVRIKMANGGLQLIWVTVNTVNDDTHFQYYPELKKAVISGIYNFDGYFSYDVFDRSGKYGFPIFTKVASKASFLIFNTKNEKIFFQNLL